MVGVAERDCARRDAGGGPPGFCATYRHWPICCCPVRVAVSRRGSEPAQPAWRDAGEIERTLAAFARLGKWRPDRDGEHAVDRSSRTDHGACRPAQAASRLLGTLLRRRRRPDLLWA